MTNETNGAPSPDPASTDLLGRRALVRRLAGTAAVAWAAPAVVGVSRASAMTLSGCVTVYDFDDGSLQGWVENGTGRANWQVSSQASSSGSNSVWFGRAGSSDSLHPVVGAPSYHRGTSRGTLTSPSVTVSSTDMISFDVRLAIEDDSQYDTFRLYIVQDGDRALLWDKSQGGFTVIPHPQNPNAPWDLYTTSGAFSTQTLTIGNPTGIDLSEPLQFEFDFQTVDGSYNRTEGIFLDNITLPCSPASLTVTAGASGFGAHTASVGMAVNGYLPGYVPPPASTAPERPPPD